MEKKKIIFLNNHFQKSDGTVRALIDLCNNLDPQKFDITIMPIYRCDMSIAGELHSNIKLKKAFGFYFRGFSSILHHIPAGLLYRILIGDRYDIVVAFQCGIPTKLVGYKRRSDRVQVAWMHGYDNFPQFYRNVDKVVCVSKANALRCVAELPYEADVNFCYNLMDDKRILENSLECVDMPCHDKPLFVTVGRLSPEKGFSRLIKILAELKDAGAVFSLIVIGGGPEESTIRSIIEKMQMHDYVYMVGKQDNPHKYTSKADLFICSSFSEGYSTACAEAAILGIPVLTTDVPGGKEIIEDCGCGLVTSIDDEGLKEGIISVLKNPCMVSEWKNVLKHNRFKFGLEYRKQKMNELFQELYEMSEKRSKLQ